MDTAIPVLMLRPHRHQGLGILRSLGRLGIAVHCVDGDPGYPGRYSRYCRSFVNWDMDQAAPADTVSQLLDAAARIGHSPILVPGTDAGCVFVAENAAVLSGRYRFPAAPPGIVHRLANKKEMHLLACRHGIPAPATTFPASLEDVLAFASVACFPVVLKRLDMSRTPWGRGDVRTAIARDRAELLVYFQRMALPEDPDVMLQEYIPGGDDTIWMFNGYFGRSSECLFAATGQKLREYPVHTGATSLGVCRPNATIVRQTREFMKAVGYHGILDVGYRFDVRDGRYKILDVNPRIGSTFRLFTAPDGMDVMRACYLDLTGQPVPSSLVREGRKWLVEDQDLVSSWRYWRGGELSLGAWAKSFYGVEECAWLALDDLLPLAPLSFSNARAAWRRMRSGAACTAPDLREDPIRRSA